jgi:hypothetical protein
MKLITTFILVAGIVVGQERPAEDTKLTQELDLIQLLQVHVLKKLGCVREVKDKRYLTVEVMRSDCGKPTEEDTRTWLRARKLAKELFEIREVPQP